MDWLEAGDGLPCRQWHGPFCDSCVNVRRRNSLMYISPSTGISPFSFLQVIEKSHFQKCLEFKGAGAMWLWICAPYSPRSSEHSRPRCRVSRLALATGSSSETVSRFQQELWMPAMASNMAIWQFGRAGRVPMDGWQFSPFHHVYYSLETQCMIDRLSLLGAWAGGEAVCDCAVVPGSQAHHTCRLFKDCQVPICFVPKKKVPICFSGKKNILYII